MCVCGNSGSNASAKRRCATASFQFSSFAHAIPRLWFTIAEFGLSAQVACQSESGLVNRRELDHVFMAKLKAMPITTMLDSAERGLILRPLRTWCRVQPVKTTRPKLGKY